MYIHFDCNNELLNRCLYLIIFNLINYTFINRDG